MASVAGWSQQQGYHYHCIGDKLFDWVTLGLRAKLQDRKPILADLARLRWIESELAVRGGLVQRGVATAGECSTRGCPAHEAKAGGTDSEC